MSIPNTAPGAKGAPSSTTHFSPAAVSTGKITISAAVPPYTAVSPVTDNPPDSVPTAGSARSNATAAGADPPTMRGSSSAEAGPFDATRTAAAKTVGEYADGTKYRPNISSATAASTMPAPAPPQCSGT
ncbi:hypothetical protein HNP40_000773 [Mycobacteroides chelonae]|nr:hypothetical protein [Mycobacteroides chelonae]